MNRQFGIETQRECRPVADIGASVEYRHLCPRTKRIAEETIFPIRCRIGVFVSIEAIDVTAAELIQCHAGIWRYRGDSARRPLQESAHRRLAVAVTPR